MATTSRGTVVSLLEADVKTVMENGGWKSLKVMARCLHPTDARKLEAVNAIGRGRSGS